MFPSRPRVYMLPCTVGNVDDGSCRSSGGVCVRYTRIRASSAACVAERVSTNISNAQVGRRKKLLTRYSAIRSDAPKPSPSWSTPEKIPTTNTGELENRPVSLSRLHHHMRSAVVFGSGGAASSTYRDFGSSRPYFCTISSSDFLGLKNLSIDRMSTWRVRK